MAITRPDNTIDIYYGLSSDTKPASTDSPPPKYGSLFFETDTLNWFMTPDGGTTWGNFTEPGQPSYKVTLADDGSHALPDATSGFAIIKFGNTNNYRATFFWDTSANIQLIEYGGSGYVAFADTDGYLCLIDGGTQLTIKNRTGAAGVLQVLRFCS